jgi:hypothetical protein
MDYSVWSLIKRAVIASSLIPASLTDFSFVQDTGKVLEDSFNGFGHRHIQGPGDSS